MNIKAEQNKQAQLAEQFSEFYYQLTSSVVDQIGNYKIIEEIGEGAFGKVYLASHIILNMKVVLKCGLIDDPNIVREIYYHKQLKNKNIVSLYEVVRTEKHLWLVLEYCSGGELFYHIYERRRLDLNECKALFIQIVLAVKYVHSLNLSHRDLKLENILLLDLKKSIIKLSDFGFVREYNPKARKFLSTICGTNVYMAPELLKNQKYSGFSIDIWSLGVILYTMVYGEMPFDEDDDMKTKFKIIHHEPGYSDTIPPDLILLIKKMLSKDPSQRPDLNDILNSSFLIDSYSKHLRKQKKHHDSDSINSINQLNRYRPFQSKLEKSLLHRLQKMNIDSDHLEYSMHKNEMNPLTAFYELLLTEEFNKKKQKINKEKQRKYYEAKKSFIRSGKRVRSVLSLSDQGSLYSSNPIERITSTLSLTSLRHNSVSRYNDSRRSSFQDKRTNSMLNQIPNIEPASPRGLRGASKTSDFDNSTALPSPNLLDPNSALQIPSRTVAFESNDAISLRNSSVSGVSEVSDHSKPKSKEKKILSKLQFWKKLKGNNENDLDNTSASLERDLTFSQRQSIESPMDSATKRSAEIIDLKQNSNNLPTKDGNQFIDETKNINFADNLNIPTNFELRKDLMKAIPRPVSMISQFSQFSNTSHMSGSEFLDESDVMDEEDYDYEEEGVYESSIERHQQESSDQSRSHINGTTHTTKRPKYHRNQSSDLSISSGYIPTNTTKRKASLSQFSSNSSEDSSSSMPLNLETYNKDAGNRPSSPGLPTSKQWKNSLFSNQLNNPVPTYPVAVGGVPAYKPGGMPVHMMRSTSPPTKPVATRFKLKRHGGKKQVEEKVNGNYHPVITEEDEMTG